MIQQIFFYNLQKLYSKGSIKTQKELAGALGVSESAVADWYRREFIPIDHLIDIANIFNVDVHELFKKEEGVDFRSVENETLDDFENLESISYSKATFATNLKKYLKQNSMAQTELARVLEVQTNTVQAWVKGKAIPTPENIDRICDILEIHVSKLFEECFRVSDKENSTLSKQICTSNGASFKNILITIRVLD